MNLRNQILGIAGAAALSLGIASSAFAQTATTTVAGGTLSASISNAALSGVNYSFSTAQTSTGAFTLTVDDSRGTASGWNVVVSASNFASGTDTIANTNFSLGTVATPVITGGQAVSATGGPRAVQPTVATLDAARKVISADAGFGEGSYTQNLPVSLAIAAGTNAGTYTSTAAVTSASGPGV